MDLVRALDVAEQPFLHDRTTVAGALLALAEEVYRLQAEAKRARELKTLGGIPPETDKEWANVTLAPPASASDPKAAPVGAPGMVSSAQYYSTKEN